MRRWLPVLLSLAAGPAMAETLIAARTIRPQEVLMPSDVVLTAANIPGTVTEPADAVGLEARIAIYAGRPIRPGDLGPPAIVERNALVVLRYFANGLDIAAEGRALARGGEGDLLKVMNLSSRTIVTGRVAADGTIDVSPSYR